MTRKIENANLRPPDRMTPWMMKLNHWSKLRQAWAEHSPSDLTVMPSYRWSFATRRRWKLAYCKRNHERKRETRREGDRDKECLIGESLRKRAGGSLGDELHGAGGYKISNADVDRSSAAWREGRKRTDALATKLSGLAPVQGRVLVKWRSSSCHRSLLNHVA